MDTNTQAALDQIARVIGRLAENMETNPGVGNTSLTLIGGTVGPNSNVTIKIGKMRVKGGSVRYVDGKIEGTLSIDVGDSDIEDLRGERARAAILALDHLAIALAQVGAGAGDQGKARAALDALKEFGPAMAQAVSLAVDLLQRFLGQK